MRSSATLCLLVILTCSHATFGQTIPGRWEKVDALSRGSIIQVMLSSGDRTEYTFVSAEPDALLLTNADGREIRLAKSDVRTVTRERADRLRNGVLIGTGVGFAAGFLSLAAFNAKQTASGPIWDSEAVGYYIAAGLIAAGIGAVTGLAVDAARKSSETLYLAK